MTRADAGFTLLEVMVAMAVFSLAAMALLNLAGENARAAVSVEERTFATVVAENRAVEALVAPVPPPLGDSDGVETQGGRDWRWRRQVSRTQDPTILRIDVEVSATNDTRTAGEISLFRSAP